MSLRISVVCSPTVGGCSDDHGGASELDGFACYPHGAGDGVWDFHHDFALGEVGVAGRLGGGVDGGAWDAERGEVVGGFLHLLVGEPLGESFFEGVGVLGAEFAGGEAFVFEPVGALDGFAEAVPHIFVGGGYYHPAVGGLVGSAGAASVALAGLFVSVAEVGGDGNFVGGVSGVGEADFEFLAHAGEFAFAEGGEGAYGGVEGGYAVYEGEEGSDGRVVGEAGEGHEAAHSLSDGVESDAVAVGAVLSVGGHVYHDDAGVEFLEGFVAEAHDVNGAWPEVLEEEVGLFHEVSEDFLALVGSEVDGEALLAGVVLYPVGALSPDSGAVAAAFVSAEGFYLDDFGAHSREHEGAAGASLVSAEVEESEAFERRVELSHASYVPFCRGMA